MSNDETFFITPENLVVVFSEFFKIFKSNPLLVVPMDEVVSIWTDTHKLTEDGDYEVLDSDLKEFMNKINGIQVDRIMIDMDKKGLAQLGWHNGETYLIANKA
jgi:hypothetical protein